MPLAAWDWKLFHNANKWHPWWTRLVKTHLIVFHLILLTWEFHFFKRLPRLPWLAVWLEKSWRPPLPWECRCWWPKWMELKLWELTWYLNIWLDLMQPLSFLWFLKERWWESRYSIEVSTRQFQQCNPISFGILSRTDWWFIWTKHKVSSIQLFFFWNPKQNSRSSTLKSYFQTT